MCLDRSIKQMNEQLNKQKNRKTHTQMYKQTKGQTDGQTSFTEYKCVLREMLKSWINRYTNIKTESHIHRCTDRQKDRCMDIQVLLSTSVLREMLKAG
jgi:hypothetical protein